MKIKVLLVEDDDSLGFVVKDSLEELGYDVRLEVDGVAGLQAFHQEQYHILLLDVMMPKKDGFTLGKEIKAADSKVPIIFLTAKGEKEDKVQGFKTGADDYITKPFSIEELELRIQAVINRCYPDISVINNQSIIELGSFQFDYQNFMLIRNGEEQQLTEKEAEVLKVFCAHKNKVLKRENILEAIWGENDYFMGRSLDVFIAKLRKYLKVDESVQIKNIHGVGFKLMLEED